MKKLFITLFSLVAFATSSYAQSEYKPVDFTLQLKNMHLWRGYTVTNTPMTAVDLHYNSKTNILVQEFGEEQVLQVITKNSIITSLIKTKDLI